MRARDVRAITFCIATTALVLVGALLIVESYIVSLALTIAYATWVGTRPRMLRVYGRLRGDPDWSVYFDNDGTRFTSDSETEGPGPTHRPAGRR